MAHMSVRIVNSWPLAPDVKTGSQPYDGYRAFKKKQSNNEVRRKIIIDAVVDNMRKQIECVRCFNSESHPVILLCGGTLQLVQVLADALKVNRPEWDILVFSSSNRFDTRKAVLKPTVVVCTASMLANIGLQACSILLHDLPMSSQSTIGIFNVLSKAAKIFKDSVTYDVVLFVDANNAMVSQATKLVGNIRSTMTSCFDSADIGRLDGAGDDASVVDLKVNAVDRRSSFITLPTPTSIQSMIKGFAHRPNPHYYENAPRIKEMVIKEDSDVKKETKSLSLFGIIEVMFNLKMNDINVGILQALMIKTYGHSNSPLRDSNFNTMLIPSLVSGLSQNLAIRYKCDEQGFDSLTDAEIAKYNSAADLGELLFTSGNALSRVWSKYDACIGTLAAAHAMLVRPEKTMTDMLMNAGEFTISSEDTSSAPDDLNSWHGRRFSYALAVE